MDRNKTDNLPRVRNPLDKPNKQKQEHQTIYQPIFYDYPTKTFTITKDLHELTANNLCIRTLSQLPKSLQKSNPKTLA